jgi:hypothetical protein
LSAVKGEECFPAAGVVGAVRLGVAQDHDVVDPVLPGHPHVDQLRVRGRADEVVLEAEEVHTVQNVARLASVRHRQRDSLIAAVDIAAGHVAEHALLTVLGCRQEAQCRLEVEVARGARRGAREELGAFEEQTLGADDPHAAVEVATVAAAERVSGLCHNRTTSERDIRAAVRPLEHVEAAPDVRLAVVQHVEVVRLDRPR